MRYLFKKHTISNNKGDVVELPMTERTRQLLSLNIIELVIEKPKPVRKGGRKPQDKKAETK